MGKDDDPTDEQWLELPMDAVREGYFERLRALLQEQLHHPHGDPKSRERPPREREEQEFEERRRTLGDRGDRLLARIEEREHEIEYNAIRLRDGRRVYVDGERYRDEHAHVLTGAEEAEAARAHELNPNASTWQQKQELERQAEEMRKLKEKILRDREQGTPPDEAERRMSDYEKEFDQQAASRTPTDYGSAYYMSVFGDDYQISSQPAFAEASSVTRETSQQPSEKETESATADGQKAPRPPGQGALKLG